MNIPFKQIICISIFFQNLYAEDESLYDDYKTPKRKNIAERMGIEFGYDYIKTNGIDAKERLGFNSDMSSIGTRMSFSYLLWEPNDIFDLSVSMNWSFQDPYYMGLTYYGFNGRYHLNKNQALRFIYTNVTHGEIGGDKRDLELGTGNLWGIGYEYKLNNTYKIFLDYKKASLEEVNLITSNNFREEPIKYSIDMFSIGLSANFNLKKTSTKYDKFWNSVIEPAKHLNNDGEIEDMSISIGHVWDYMNLQIKDNVDTLNYKTKESTSIPITIKSKSKFLNKSKTLGYKLFSVGFNIFNYSKQAGHYYLPNVPEEVTGHYIYISPSIFYTNSFEFQNQEYSWKIEASSGVSFLTLDAQNLNHLDTKNQWGTYNTLSTEIGMKKNLIILKYSKKIQKYNNHGIKYNIDGDSFGMYVNLKFKDIFNKDW